MTLSSEQTYWLNQIAASQAEYVIGADEVGAGAWAGDVTVCAAVVLKGWTHSQVRDSKKLSPERREMLVEHVLVPPTVLYHVILSNPPAVIDRLGLRRAIDECVGQAVELCLMKYPEAVIVMDGNVVPEGLPSRTICLPKADDLVPAVSAASILAKVHRDAYMDRQDALHPGYAFSSNKGYGTAAHESGLKAHGPCAIHRLSFRPVKEYLRA